MKRIKEILQDCANQIKQNMAQNNINASGRTSRSIKVVEYNGGIKLVSQSDEKGFAPLSFGNGGFVTGIAPMATLEVGRAGGNVPRGFYYIIRQWTRDKGLQFDSESERGTFAYFVAKKIANEGTRRFKENKNVYTTPVEVATERIKKELFASIREQIATHVFKM